jgi:hypothetical protein
MPEPETNLSDFAAIARDVRRIYSLLTAMEKTLADHEERIAALEAGP